MDLTLYSEAPVILAVTTCLVTFVVFAAMSLRTPKPVLSQETNEVLDPVGGSYLKNCIGLLMAKISRFKETRKWKQDTAKGHESFHRAENHQFFNESHYYNGAQASNNDRMISRISRHAHGGKVSYVFLLLDLTTHGELSLEHDQVPVNFADENPSASGLQYRCVTPMKEWELTYDGPMKRGCHPPGSEALKNAKQVHVQLKLRYSVESPLFWYMRDDCPTTLAKNLAQEPWGMDFVKVCLKRSNNHGHYEDFGSCKGTIKVDGSAPEEFDFATFRDHSWDIRRWATIDNLLILLFAFHEPIILFGKPYDFLDLTLVGMPGNTSGVARYTTGYLVSRSHSDILKIKYATSINAIEFSTDSDGVREPLDETKVTIIVGHDDNDGPEDTELTVEMFGDVRRLLYWPDDGAFKVYEDSMEFRVSHKASQQIVSAYGTRQSGFRIGEFDPSLGGCG